MLLNIEQILLNINSGRTRAHVLPYIATPFLGVGPYRVINTCQVLDSSMLCEGLGRNFSGKPELLNHVLTVFHRTCLSSAGGRKQPLMMRGMRLAPPIAAYSL